MEAGGWRRALAELTEMLREHAELLAYGCIKHGSAVTYARLGSSLRYDRPPRRDLPLRDAHRPGNEAFEDAYAPDAFGVQLLGPGYAGRVPDSPAWRQQRVGSASVLLEHIDLPAWFEAPFVPCGSTNGELTEPPAVLAQARAELAPILYTPAVLDSDVKP